MKTQESTYRFSSRICVLAYVFALVLLVGIAARPASAYAAENDIVAGTPGGMAVQASPDGNTTFAKAMELSLGQSYTGTFDYIDGTTKFEEYWFKFKTSDRRSRYEIQIDSIDGKTIQAAPCNSNGGDDSKNWYGENGRTVWSYGNDVTSSRMTWHRSDADKNAWVYVWVNHYNATRYQQYRIQVKERGVLATDDVSLSQDRYTYSGLACMPTVAVACGSEALVKGADYEVSYSDNVNAGTGKVTVTGTGSYSGTVTKEFAIEKVTVPIPLGRQLVYNGNQQTGVPTGAGYTVSGNIKIDAGSYFATASLPSTKNYQWTDGTSSSKRIGWQIAPADQSITVRDKTVKVSAKKLKSWSVAINASRVTRGVSAENYITYEKVRVDKKSSRFTVSSSGDIYIKQKTKKGTYRVTIRANASSSGNYKAASKTFTVTVKVK